MVVDEKELKKARRRKMRMKKGNAEKKNIQENEKETKRITKSHSIIRITVILYSYQDFITSVRLSISGASDY